MVKLERNSANVIVFTGTEKASLDNPFWLFEFEPRSTNQKYHVIATEESIQTQRYNQVTITETDVNPDNLNGEVELPEHGSYYYRVYEQDNQINLDPANATEVETGLAEMAKPDGAEITYEPDNTAGKQYQKDE